MTLFTITVINYICFFKPEGIILDLNSFIPHIHYLSHLHVTFIFPSLSLIEGTVNNTELRIEPCSSGNLSLA